MTAQTQVPEQLARPSQPMREQQAWYAAVSNLLVVLCSEQATQQAVNTGSLYA
ncbi:MAG TPA: hypothetical protein VMI73_09785 [Trebonia sp.]|nr:hypothetical protein [Trebonia sp.]